MKRATEEKHADFFLNPVSEPVPSSLCGVYVHIALLQEEKYYLRSLGDDPRKVGASLWWHTYTLLHCAKRVNTSIK